MSRLSRMANAMPAAVLRSPLHPLMSKRTMLLTFTGRRSGQRYTTPVAYLRRGDEIVSTTDSGWWKNLRGGAPVSARVAGVTYSGTGEAVTDPAQARGILADLVAHQPSYARLARLPSGSDGPDLDRAVADGRVAIRIRLDPSAPHPGP